MTHWLFFKPKNSIGMRVGGFGKLIRNFFICFETRSIPRTLVCLLIPEWILCKIMGFQSCALFVLHSLAFSNAGTFYLPFNLLYFVARDCHDLTQNFYTRYSHLAGDSFNHNFCRHLQTACRFSFIPIVKDSSLYSCIVTSTGGDILTFWTKTFFPYRKRLFDWKISFPIRKWFFGQNVPPVEVTIQLYILLRMRLQCRPTFLFTFICRYDRVQSFWYKSECCYWSTVHLSKS